MYDNLIKKHAGKCYRICNKSIPYPEILQHAYLIAYNALATWLPERGSEPAWVEYNLKSRLGKFLKKENKSPFQDTESDDFGIEDFAFNKTFNPERIAIFNDSIQNLSSDAKKILKFILRDDAISELEISTNSSARAIRGAIMKFFSNQIPYQRRQRAIRELKEISAVIGELNEA